MKQEVEKLLKTVLAELDLGALGIIVTPTLDIAHGDYATNIAFQAAKKLGKSPLEAAEMICTALSEKQSPIIEKIEVAKPGFVNITLKDSALIKDLSTEHKKLSLMNLGQDTSKFKSKKVMIEFTDPNPFKEFHIGHLYSNIVGESISRLQEEVGAEVKRVCYQGDVGLHVAKALYGLQKKISAEGLSISELENKSLEDRVKLLGQAYSLGATSYEDDEKAKAEIIVINKQVYDKDPGIMPLYEKGREWSLEYFEQIYKRLMHPKSQKAFTKYYFESEAAALGIDIVKQYIDTVFEESRGAVIFPGEKYGLHSRVFINSLGLPTYEAKELGLAISKHADYQFDLSIMITGNEIDAYFKVLLKALSMIEPELSAKMKHLSHGMVRLPEGKMSSRTGNVVTGQWLLDEAVRRADIKINEVKSEGGRVSDDNKADVSEMVGVGAVKWALLRASIGKDIEFSFDESVSLEGNSGPYLQYTYVRTRSVLEKAGNLSPQTEPEIKLSAEERSLLVLLSQYQDIVLEASEKYSPSTLSTYLFQLAQEFNLFYQKHQILKEEDGVREFRLKLTEVVGQTIKNGLYLLGIEAPERM